MEQESLLVEFSITKLHLDKLYTIVTCQLEGLNRETSMQGITIYDPISGIPDILVNVTKDDIAKIDWDGQNPSFVMADHCIRQAISNLHPDRNNNFIAKPVTNVSVVDDLHSVGTLETGISVLEKLIRVCVNLKLKRKIQEILDARRFLLT